MNMRYTAPLLTLGLLAGAAPFGIADSYSNTAGASGTSAAAAPSAQTVTGTVKKMDTTNNSLQLQDNNGNTQILKIASATLISRDGKTVQPSELKTGDTVTVQNATSDKM